MKQLRAEPERLSSKELAIKAFEAAVDQKGLDPLAFDVTGVTDITDAVLIVSGTSERHSSGIADKVKARLKELGETPTSVSGYEKGEWILLDYSNLIVHVFHEPHRQFYKLEDLLEKAKLLSIPEELEKFAKPYRTKPLP